VCTHSFWRVCAESLAAEALEPHSSDPQAHNCTLQHKGKLTDSIYYSLMGAIS